MIRALLAPAACLALASATPPLLAQPSVALAEQAARAQLRIEALHKEAEALARQERSLLVDLRRLEVQRDLRVQESRRLDAEAAALQERMDGTRREIDTLHAGIEAIRPSLERRLVEVYKLGRPGYGRLLLGARDARDTGRIVRQTVALAAIDHSRVADLRASVERLDKAAAELKGQAERLRVVQEAARAAAAEARKAAEARAALVREIDGRRDLTAQMAGELEVARQQLARVVAGEPGEVTLPLKPFRGSLEWPVAGRVVARFGQRRNPRFGTTVRSNGIEVAAAEGEPVRAVHEGRVVFADVFAGFGQLVIVDHGRLGYSLYGYLGSIGVQKGEGVGHGQRLGTVGASPGGNPALYFELRIDGRPVDPLQWLERPRIKG